MDKKLAVQLYRESNCPKNGKGVEGSFWNILFQAWAFDTYYNFSDSIEVFRAGTLREKELNQAIADSDLEQWQLAIISLAKMAQMEKLETDHLEYYLVLRSRYYLTDLYPTDVAADILELMPAALETLRTIQAKGNRLLLDLKPYHQNGIVWSRYAPHPKEIENKIKLTEKEQQTVNELVEWSRDWFIRYPDMNSIPNILGKDEPVFEAIKFNDTLKLSVDYRDGVYTRYNQLIAYI